MSEEKIKKSLNVYFIFPVGNNFSLSEDPSPIEYTAHGLVKKQTHSFHIPKVILPTGGDIKCESRDITKQNKKLMNINRICGSLMVFASFE